ncbi:MAG: PDZ domain-containing protein [Planctomycetes bacterium]|nr:PDZ domain-containing protein [Planctomycetota bacterium]
MNGLSILHRVALAVLWGGIAIAQSRPVVPTPPQVPAPAAPDPAVPPLRSRAPVAVAAAPFPALPLTFGWREGGELMLLEVEGDRAVVTAAGRQLPGDRVRRRGANVQVLDADGLVAAQVTLSTAGGTLQTFPERNRVMLGVRLVTPDLKLAQSLGLRADEIRRVGSVTPGFGAARVGLQPGDLVVELAGERPVTELRLRQLLGKRRPGDVLPLRVRRGEQLLAFDVPLQRATTVSPRLPGQSFVEFDGTRMMVVPPPGTAAGGGGGGGGLTGLAAPVGASDPLDELRSVQERLEKMERLLQRIIEMRNRAERDRATGGDARPKKTEPEKAEKAEKPDRPSKAGEARGGKDK